MAMKYKVFQDDLGKFVIPFDDGQDPASQPTPTPGPTPSEGRPDPGPMPNQDFMGPPSPFTSQAANDQPGLQVPQGVLPPVPPGQMGLKPNTDLRNSSLKQQGSTENHAQMVIDPAQYNTLLNYANDPSNMTQGEKAERRGIDDLRFQLGQYMNQKPKLDLKPLMALTDAWSGSNLAKSYESPENSQEKAEMAAKLSSEIGKQASFFDEHQMEKLRDLTKGYLNSGQQIVLGQGAQEGTKVIRGLGGKGAAAFDPTKDVADLSKRLSPLAPAQAALKQLDDAFYNLTGKHMDEWSGQNIPGEGLGGGLTPNWVLGLSNPKAAAFRQALNGFRNDALESEFGKRLTPAEKTTLSEFLGNSKMTTDGNLVQGMQMARTKLAAMIANDEAAYRGTHPEVIDRYRAGAGAFPVSSDAVMQIGRGSGSPTTQAKPGGSPPPSSQPAASTKQQRLDQIDQHLNDIGTMLKGFQSPQKK